MHRTGFSSIYCLRYWPSFLVSNSQIIGLGPFVNGLSLCGPSLLEQLMVSESFCTPCSEQQSLVAPAASAWNKHLHVTLQKKKPISKCICFSSSPHFSALLKTLGIFKRLIYLALLQASFKQVKLEEEREIFPSEIKQQPVFGNILTIDHMGVPNY